MAKRWVPSDTVTKSEIIGRRLFDEPMLVGASDQPKYDGLLINHFEEKRDKELSVDRLGQSGITKKVTSYLIPKAEYAGKQFHKSKAFNGWIWVKHGDLQNGYKNRKYFVNSSPLDGIGLEEININIYHAHIEISDHPEIDAFYLKHIFTTKGDVVCVTDGVAEGTKIKQMLRNILKIIIDKIKSYT